MQLSFFTTSHESNLVLAGIHRRLQLHEMQPYVCGVRRRSLLVPVVALPMPEVEPREGVIPL